jgi:hypothetical protein
VDIPSVNCAWLVYGKAMKNFARCVRRHGKYFLPSVVITGEKEELSLNVNCITFYQFYRRNIESAHGLEVERQKKKYSQEDKELIENFLEAKRIFNLKSESLVQEPKETGRLPGKLGIIFTIFS